MRRALAYGLLAAALPAASAHGATFTVRDTADTNNGDGCTTGPTCSLREAVNAANGADDNVVVVPAGTYVLSEGETFIQRTMTITGAGARSTVVDANGESRIFGFFPSGETATIEGMTLTGGQSPMDENGGAIVADGGNTLTLRNMNITGNTAGFGGGGVAVDTPHTTIVGLSTLNLDRTTINGNRVTATVNGQGGGVMIFGNLNATNSTIAGNVIEAGGLSLAQGGGVISASGDIGGGEESGTITLTNTTITGNRIDGLNAPAAFGGGVSGDNIGLAPFESQLRATNTIIAGNTVNGAVEDCALVDTTLSANNLSRDTSCGFGDAASKQNTDPLLGQLRNNGGPTDTLLPQMTSPAVNAGTATGCPATDQRGIARPQAGTCDIGAVELAPPGAVTGSATDITATSATIGGAFSNPHLDAGSAFFEFGSSASYGSNTAIEALAGGASGDGRSAALTGLQPGTTYHYRADAVNNDGSAVGADATFRTLTKPQAKRLRRPDVAVAGVPRRGCARRAFTVRITADAASGTRIRSVRVSLDGRLIKRSSRARFKVKIRAGNLSAGRHVLGVRATDRRGRSRLVRRSFRRCAPVRVPRFTG